jgi:hypothetical protein
MSLVHFAQGGLVSSGRQPLPTPVPRAPLPPFESPGPPDYDPVNSVPPSNLTIPARPNLRFHRGNFCGIRVPGLPPVSGGSSDPTLLLTWFLFKYTPDQVQQALTLYGQAGYSHVYLSWPDARDTGGLSISQFVSLCLTIRQRGFYVGVFFGSKDFDPHDDGVGGWPSRCQALCQALSSAGAIDFAMPGWEWNLWNVPGPSSYDIFRFFQAQLPGVLLYYHGGVGNIAWQADGEDTASFYNNLVGVLTGCLYQADVNWSASFLQEKINDVLVRFGGADGFPADSGFGHPFDCIPFEISASTQFDARMGENMGDLRNLEALYTLGPVACMGYGNGCRNPDGTAL